MCGLFGGIGVERVPDPVFSAMAQRLAHRGPDGVAVERRDGVVLGLTRLAIVGTAEPAKVQRSGRISAVMNGEVYNHRALRRRVEVDGLSDAAVVPALFAQEGRRFVESLEGPFALALTDGRVVHLVRDRLGKKPLFFRTHGRRAFFASEQKALVVTPGFRGEVDEAVSQAFLRRGFLRDDELLFRELSVVGPGEWVTIDESGRVTRRRWWRLEAQVDSREVQQVVPDVARTLRDAVQARVPDEVPWALLLSGGLDSTLLGAGAKSIPRAVCMERPGAGDAKRAQVAAKALGVTLETVRLPAPSIEGLERALFHLEQPEAFTTWSMAPAVLALGDWLRRQGLKVALMGEGADELFLGYAWDGLEAAFERGDARVPEDAARLLGPHLAYVGLARSMAQVFTKTPRARDVWLMAAGARAAGEDLDAGRFARFRGARRRQLVGLGHDLLTLPIPHADRLLMASGVEPRMPFLDHRLVSLALSLGPQVLESPHEDKPVLRAVAKRWLPHFTAPPKSGFSGDAMPGPVELEALRARLCRGPARVIEPAVFRRAKRMEPLGLWRHVVLELTARLLLA
jgi:asparagine synthase (glutamine-hydrolysing)